MTKIKICGIQTVEDALFCEKIGVDAIGLVFYPRSPRNVSLEVASEIVNALPPFFTIVGLLVNPDPQMVGRILSQVKLDCLQFHGDESNDFCQQFARKWYKAIRIKPRMDVPKEIAKYPDSAAILLDAWHQSLPGGTGMTFNWKLLPAIIAKPVILAGGLTSTNVQQALLEVKPWAVDVSGGVERTKGIKDQQLIRRFVTRVKT